MKRAALTLILLLVGILAVGAYLTLFTVHQTQQALVLEFGKPKRLVTKPGLNYKIPFIQNAIFFDKRLLDLDSAPQEVIAADQKRLVVDAFARWRIANPLLYYQSVNNEYTARTQLSNYLEAALRRVLGAASFEAVVRDDRNELMRKITSQMNENSKVLGITVVDVRIKRADLPEANSLAIFRRMQTERQREAAEIRAEGEEASRRIRANADRQVTVVKAEATGESERIRGTGDAEKNRVFAEAFGKDPDFFAFYRSMQAYEGALKSTDTRMLLSPDSQFFQYFNDAAGAASGPSSSRAKSDKGARVQPPAEDTSSVREAGTPEPASAAP
ncbi:MAG: protease modulator HflC [Methyloceanibacter sp.]|uniref:protease modulator HflC n=1 Tax=Methyloceanibacter sp. TaxID=1965321 RepID=UPI001D2CBDA8|nr:protease modulator HflC [Methyloceanibacter sp.]MCB1441921.1 protease modulator HflC [Methyloceanibacter sp.]MCC0058434.1 protease modulator HflC [Hyphomicrobiaceae bacterium]